MRESKKRVTELRKDRKFGKGGTSGGGSSSGKKFGKSNSAPDKKNSECYACGQTGHWAGDAACPKLKEWKAEQAKKKLHQRVRTRDAMVVDLLDTNEGHEALRASVPEVFEVLMAAGSVPPADGNAVGGDASPLAVGNADGGDAQTWNEHIQEVLLSSVSIGGQCDDGAVVA